MIWELSPHISTRIWGGNKLKQLKGLSIDLSSGDPIGETWEVSTHVEGVSKTLKDLTPLNSITNLNYLIKFLDTADVLSVQVHPDDNYSQKHEGQKGKCECWIILEGAEGSGIYLGFKPGVKLEELKKGILNKENISEYLNFYPVKKGDFFYLPPGTIHAIGAGVTLVEVQQSSGVTYRVWDWNRVDAKGKSRELHVDRALDVLVDDPKKNTLEYFKYRSNLFDEFSIVETLAHHEDFKLTFYSIEEKQEIRIRLVPSKYSAIIVLDGAVEFDQLKSGSYQSFLVHDLDALTITGLSSSKIIVVE